MHHYSDERKRRIRRLVQQRRKQVRLRQRCLMLLSGLILASLTCVVPACGDLPATMPPAASWQCSAEASEHCAQWMILPIESGSIIREFDGPAQPWMAGHRGIDISVSKSHEIIAPTDAVISFSGLVGGKSVVSLEVDGYTLTFEPARTQLQVGAQVQRRQKFAAVSGDSDHCADTCVHWGVKRTSTRDYVDPQRFLTPQHIRLVPNDA